METTERTIDHGEPPFQAWSEEIPDFICSVCEKDGETYEAVTYCTICCEFMCTRSLMDHNKFSPNKSHRLLGKSEMRAQGKSLTLSIRHGSDDISNSLSGKSLTLSIRHGSDDISNSLSHSIRHGSDTMDVSLSQSILRGSDAMASSFSDSSQQGIDAVSNSYEQYQELERRLEECQNELHQKKTELDNQRREYEYSTQRCADLIVDMTDMKTCKDDLQKKLEQSQDRADTQAKEDKERYDKLESEHKEIKHRLHAMSTELDIQCRVKDGFKMKRDLVEKQCVELEQKVKDITRHKEELQTYLKDEKDGRVKVNNRLNEVQADLEKKETEIKSLLKDIEDMKQLKQSADMNHAELVAQLGDEKKTNLKLEKTIQENTKEFKNLKEKLTESENRLELKSPNIHLDKQQQTQHDARGQRKSPHVQIKRQIKSSDICLQRFSENEYLQLQSFDQICPSNHHQRLQRYPRIMSLSISFGASKSCCSYSFKTDSHTIRYIDLDRSKQRTEAPTYVLIQPDGKTLHSFGSDALCKYEELVEEGSYKDWYFFKGFNPLLFSQSDIGPTTLVKDINGREYPLGRVISLCITYLQNYICKLIESQDAYLNIFEDIHWVLVIPDICTTEMAQVIVNAAEECFHGCMVTRINEAEASLLYCYIEPMDKCEFSLQDADIGTKYIVFKVEDELAICSVHEVMPRQVIRRTGTGCVMLDIDNVVKEFFDNLFGSQVMKLYQEQHQDEYTEETSDFKQKLTKYCCKDIFGKNRDTLTISYIDGLQCVLFDNGLETVKQAIGESIYAGQVNVRNRKLRVDTNVFVELFQTYYMKLADIAQDLVAQDVSAIFMTGKHFKCDIVLDIMRKSFESAKIVFGPEYIFTGATLYGHVSGEATLGQKE